MSANARLLDAGIRRQVGLGLLGNATVRRIMATLNKADAELFTKLKEAIEATGDTATFKVERLEGQLNAVRQMNAALYDRINNDLSTELSKLSTDELGFHGELLSEPVRGLRVPFTALAPTEVYAATMARPFQGRLLREWSAGLGEARMMRMRDAIRMGFIQGETVDQMVRRVRGTKALGYADGILEIDRRNAAAVVRTAISHVAAVARDMTFDANSDLLKGVRWVSTLDSRTSPICRARDGAVYTHKDHKPVGHSMPWLGGPGQAHWNCRSTAVPVLKSFADLGIDMPDLPKSVRASMDGAVPEDMTYAQWFGKQSAARQDTIVGPTRGAMFRKGEVSFDKFTNDKGRMLRLDELRAFSLGE